MKKPIKKIWTSTPQNKLAINLTNSEKKEVSSNFQPLVEFLKDKCISENPDKKYNYLIDIYTKWYRKYFYLCEKFKSEFPDRIVDEFEVKLVRLEYTDKDSFDLSYLRHNEQWFLLAENQTLKNCIEMINENTFLQPISEKT